MLEKPNPMKALKDEAVRMKSLRGYAQGNAKGWCTERSSKTLAKDRKGDKYTSEYGTCTVKTRIAKQTMC